MKLTANDIGKKVTPSIKAAGRPVIATLCAVEGDEAWVLLPQGFRVTWENIGRLELYEEPSTPQRPSERIGELTRKAFSTGVTKELSGVIGIIDFLDEQFDKGVFK